MLKRLALLCYFAALSSMGDGSALAQMIHTGVPLESARSGYFEQSGVQWSLRGPNFFANSGGGVVPPFGSSGQGFGSGAGVGFGLGGGIGGSINFNMAQGSSRSISSGSASVTTLDGYPGSISSQTIRPFVTGVTPVIGGYSYGSPTTENASNQMFQSHLQSQNAALQARLNANLQAKQSKAAEAFQRALEADSSGNLRKARANYRKALALDQGPLRRQILLRMQTRGWK